MRFDLEFHLLFSIRDCANDLIRDISDAIFEELVKYKTQTNNIDDGENENKYQIELAESESRPLNLYVSKYLYVKIEFLLSSQIESVVMKKIMIRIKKKIKIANLKQLFHDKKVI